MKYKFVAVLATSTFTILASANGQIPSGCTHQDKWGNAVVENKCSEPAYFILDNEQATATVAGGSQTSVPIYEKDADKGGMSIKLFKDKDTDIWAVPAITQFEITATDLQYFDISNVNSNIGGGKNGNGEDCDKEPPFMNDGMSISTPDGKDVTCAAGENPCKTAYSKNDDNFATSATPLGNDITLTLCPGGGSSKSGGGQDTKSVDTKPVDTKPQEVKTQPEQPKAAEPETPKLEVKKKEIKHDDNHNGRQDGKEKDEEVVYVTVVQTADTAVQTVFVDENNQPIEHKEKRAEHIHQHIHNKIHKRRHGA